MYGRSWLPVHECLGSSVEGCVGQILYANVRVVSRILCPRLSGFGTFAGRNFIENIDEFINESLALDAKQEVLKMLIRQVPDSTGVTPKHHCRDMRCVFVHRYLDCHVLILLYP